MALPKSDLPAVEDASASPVEASAPTPVLPREDTLSAREWAELVLHTYGVELVSTFHDLVVRQHTYFDTARGWERRFADWVAGV
jgi:hypothetical protein